MIDTSRLVSTGLIVGCLPPPVLAVLLVLLVSLGLSDGALYRLFDLVQGSGGCDLCRVCGVTVSLWFGLPLALL